MNILTAIDFSANSNTVMKFTAKLASSLGAKVRLVHVAEAEPGFMGFDGGPDEVRDQIAKEFHDERINLQLLADELRKKNIDATALLKQGPIAETILTLADKHNVEIIIVGSHGHGAVYDILVGSISAAIIKNAKCPVTIVPLSE